MSQVDGGETSPEVAARIWKAQLEAPPVLHAWFNCHENVAEQAVPPPPGPESVEAGGDTFLRVLRLVEMDYRKTPEVEKKVESTDQEADANALANVHLAPEIGQANQTAWGLRPSPRRS